MRVLISFALLVPACTQTSTSISDPDRICAPFTSVQVSGTPTIASIHCTSTKPGDDLAIDVVATSTAGKLAIHFERSTPAAIDRTFCATTSYSGHFWNFDDVESLAHLRSRSDPGYPDSAGDDNAQIFTDSNHQTATIDTGDILCDTIWKP